MMGMRPEFISRLDFDVVPLIGFENRKRMFPVKMNLAQMWGELDRCRNNARALVAYLQKKWITVQFIGPDDEKAKDVMVIAGEFEPDFEGRYGVVYDDVRVLIFTTREGFNSHEFSDAGWGAFKRDLLQIAMHELVHARQFSNSKRRWLHGQVRFEKSRRLNINVQREYLADMCEVEAYAHCCYIELMSNYRKFDFSKLPEKLTRRIKCDSLRFYLRVFGYKDAAQKPVIKRLITHIRAWERRYRVHVQTALDNHVD